MSSDAPAQPRAATIGTTPQAAQTQALAAAQAQAQVSTGSSAPPLCPSSQRKTRASTRQEVVVPRLHSLAHCKCLFDLVGVVAVDLQ